MIEPAWNAARAAALSIAVTEAPMTADYDALLGLLEAEAAPLAGPMRLRPLAVLLRDDTGATAGGLLGRTAYGWLTIELLFVPVRARGNGIGSALPRIAQMIALSRSRVGARVETFDFQAAPFYEKSGFTIFATLDDLPPDRNCVVLTRRFGPADRAALNLPLEAPAVVLSDPATVRP